MYIILYHGFDWHEMMGENTKQKSKTLNQRHQPMSIIKCTEIIYHGANVDISLYFKMVHWLSHKLTK